MERKSPKKKKAKSYSKLSELDKEICPDTGQLIDPQQSSSDLDSPLSIKKLKSKAKAPYMRIRTSPKKMRPKDIPISGLNAEAKVTKAVEADITPQSAPPSRKGHTEMGEEFVFDYEEMQASPEEFSILEKCIRQYEVFFEGYMFKKVLQVPNLYSKKQQKAAADGDELNVEEIFKNEKVYEDHNVERSQALEHLFETLRVQIVNRTKYLQNLLHRTMDAEQAMTELNNATNALTLNKYDEQTTKCIQRLMNSRLNNNLRHAVKLASNLLVEMSTFPNCNKHIVLDKQEQDIPSWLKVLTLMACYAASDKELQLSAITTLFDLISLLKSQIEHITSPGVTFVVMLPLLKFGHVSYLEQRTRVFHLLTSVLWNYLGATGVDAAQITSLLYQLHNCLDSGLVETVIGQRMHGPAKAMLLQPQQTNALLNYSQQKHADLQLICVSPFLQNEDALEMHESESASLKKFELLWHMGRDKQIAKGFEKTLLKILDTLALPHYMSMRVFVTKWLQSALLRGDLPRLIKPLYKILLSANTKRISIIHLQLLQHENENSTVVIVGSQQNGVEVAEQTQNNDASALERDVYAISSEFGNIKYHLDASTGKKRSPIRNFQKKIFGVTLSSKNKTSNFVSDKSSGGAQTLLTPADVEETFLPAPIAIGLIINPLDRTPDFDEDPDTENTEIANDNVAEKESEKLEQDEKEKEEDFIEDEEEDDDLEEEEQDEDLEPDCEQDFTDESESDIFDNSESEQRDTSLEKEEIVSAINVHSLKRFAGDCELVTEKLTQHERTKNRKTYRLTREKTPGDISLTSTTTSTTTEDQNSLSNATIITTNNDEEAVHTAEDYFKQQQQQMSNVEHENELDENADDSITTTTTVTTASNTTTKKKKHRRLRTSLAAAALSAGKQKTKKLMSAAEKKRLSCMSKTSTDSNNSLCNNSQTNEINDERKTLGESEEETFVATINVEDKRRLLSLETQKCNNNNKPADLEVTLERSKRNSVILRENAAADAAAAAAASVASYKPAVIPPKPLDVKQLQFYHQQMLIYLGKYSKSHPMK